MQVDEYLEFTNARGETFRFGGGACGLVSVEGLGDVAAAVQLSRAPFQDGATLIDTVLEPRYITMEFILRADNYAGVRQGRSNITRVLSPRLGAGLLRYVSGDTERIIYAVAESVPVFPDGEARGERWQRGLLTLVCPNPYWQDVNPTMLKLQDFVGNFFFPVSFPASFSIRGDQENFVNVGDVPAPIKVTFRGEAVNPMITNVSTGEFIRVKRTIPAEHSLVITTDLNYRTVRIIDPYGIETSAMGYIDLESTFFSLDVGENNLSFITDGGNPEVFIEYRNRYLSV